MATVVEIERLQALVERLRPLAGKVRGELVAADDWNTLVGAIVEIGRATIATGQQGVAPHEHPDQVGIGWLDPQLRQIVTGGGLKDPALDAALLKLRRDVSLLDTRLGRVGDDLSATRTRVDVVATNDLTRSATLDVLHRKVLGAADDRGDIADLRTTLRTLQTEVGRAVEVGARLEVDGAPVDVPGLVQRVADVEALRERLTRPDGSLLDASALEVRLTELAGSLVTQDQLTEAIKDVRAEVGGGDLDGVLDAARAAAQERASAAVDALGADLRSQLQSRFAELDGMVTTAVARATGDLAEQVLTTSRTEVAEALKGLDDRLRESLAADLDARLAAVDARTDELVARLEEQVRGQVAQAVEGAVASTLREVDARLGKLDEQQTGLAAQLEVSGKRLDQLDERVEVVRRTEESARDQLRKDLLTEIGRVEAEIDGKLGRGLVDVRGQLALDLEANVAAQRRELEVTLGEVARQAAATEVQVLGAGLRSDVQGVVRQAVTEQTAGVQATVANELAGLQLQVAGLVTNEVARQTQDIPTIVEKQLATVRPELERIVDTRLGRG